MTTETRSSEVINRFAGRSAEARERLARWRQDPHKAEVVPAVEQHKVVFAYELCANDVEQACVRTEHALGEAKRSVAESVVSIRDWHPAFAFTHVLHIALEALQQIPTFQGFRDWTRDDPGGRAMLWEPARDAASDAIASGFEPSAVQQAVRWRVGNAYYSFIKELFVLVSLRDRGLDLRFHPLADALFRVDAWSGDANLSLFVGNPVYRGAGRGRKEPPEAILADAAPPFHFVTIELETRRSFGDVHLPTAAALDAAAANLEERGASRRS